MAQTTRRRRHALRRGMTFMDMLIATFIIVVALIGMLNLVTFLMRVTTNHTETTVVYSVGRSSVEMVRNQGFPRFPEGPYVRYFNAFGTNPTLTPTADSAYKATINVVSDSLADGFQDDRPSSYSLRTVDIQVDGYPRGGNKLHWATVLCRGGV